MKSTQPSKNMLSESSSPQKGLDTKENVSGASFENANLQTPSLCKEDRAFHWSYWASNEPTSDVKEYSNSDDKKKDSTFISKSSVSLPVGTLEKLIGAAWIGFEKGFEINTLATFRLSSFDGEGCPLVSPGGYEGVKSYIGQLRRWLTRPNRQIPLAYFWVRETVGEEGEHLHIGIHIPGEHLSSFSKFIERSTGEAMKHAGRASHKRTRGEIAVGEFESWHVTNDDGKGKRPFPGYWIAAYCGKSEPSQRLFRGSLVANMRKPERGKEFGGRLSRSKYDSFQGAIQGNHARKGRFSISRSLLKS